VINHEELPNRDTPDAGGATCRNRTTQLRPARQAPEPIARGSEALAFHALAQQLAVPAHRLGFLAGAALGRFFEGAAELHFAEDALPLHFFLQDAKRLIDIVVTDDDLHETPLLWAKKNGPQNRSRPKKS
jgi:hypothetical protein